MEQELELYEETVPPSTSGSTDHTHSGSEGRGALDGCGDEVVGTLVRGVKRLMGHLRQSEVQLRGEVAVRTHFLHTLQEQQDLMDVLTAVRECTVLICPHCCV